MKRVCAVTFLCVLMLLGSLYAVDFTSGEIVLKNAPNYNLFCNKNSIAIVSDLEEGSLLNSEVMQANNLIQRHTVHLPVYVQIDIDDKINGATLARSGENLALEKSLILNASSDKLEVSFEHQVGVPGGVGMIGEVVYPEQKVYKYQINWTNGTRVEKVTAFDAVLIKIEDANSYDYIYEKMLNNEYRDIYGAVMAMPNGEIDVFETYISAKYDVSWDVELKLVEGMKALNNSKPSFVDLSEKHWAYGAVEEMAASGYLTGYEDNTFRPENNITRAEVAQIISKFFSLNEINERDIDDIHDSHWAYEAVKKASLYIPMVGNNFEPETCITRKDFVLAIMRLEGVKRAEADNKFSDLQNLDEDIVSLINLAFERGVVKGYEDGTFRPNAPMTRAEVCAVLSRLEK